MTINSVTYGGEAIWGATVKEKTFLEFIKNRFYSYKLHRCYYLSPSHFSDLSQLINQDNNYEVIIIDINGGYGFKAFFFELYATTKTEIAIVWAWNFYDAPLCVKILN